MMIKVILTDDHPLFRQGIKNILAEAGSSAKVVGEASNVNELFSRIREVEPDIVLMDISMPGKNGLEGLKEVKMIYPELPVLILSMYPEERFALRVMKAGASGYLNKSVSAEELIKAINRIVIHKRRYITPEVADIMANNLDKDLEKQPHEMLSDREEQIMRLIAQGVKVSDIADQLFLSVHTVHTYRYRILRKLGVKTNIGIGHYAIEHELID